MEYVEALSVPAITAIVYAAITAIKEIFAEREEIKKYIPLIAMAAGMIISAFSYIYAPEFLNASDMISALITGAASGLAATGTNQIVKQLFEKKNDGKKE